MKQLPADVQKLGPSLRGLECWYVSTGGAAGSTFQLALGDKVRRTSPLKNRAHSSEFREFEGTVSLLVWCAWRLDGSDSPVTSWDDVDHNVETGLRRLIGSRIESFDVMPPAWDLSIAFSNGLTLRVFCDHVPGDPSFEGNWDMRLRAVTYSFGPGARYAVNEGDLVESREP
jgi:hypothetical protein